MSTLAIAGFHFFLGGPSGMIQPHLVTIAAIQCLFFLIWAWIGRLPAAGRHPFVWRAYAGSLFAKAVAVNLIYVLSVATVLGWGDNLSRDTVFVLVAHVRGLRAAFGLWVYLTCGGALLALLAGFAVLLRSSGARFERLRAAFPGGRPWGAAAFTGLVCAVAVVTWTFDTASKSWLRADPVISFWCNTGRLTPAVIADRDEMRNYPLNAEFRRRSVVIVIVDTLRADHVPLYGYSRDTMPFVTGLAKAGRLAAAPFAVAVGNESQQGVFAVLASRHVEAQTPSNPKIYDILRRFGYRAYVIVTGDHTSFRDMRALYGNNLDLFSDGVSPGSFTVNDDKGIVEKLERVPAYDGTPSFFFFHLMSAHHIGVRDPRFSIWHSPPSFRKRKSLYEQDPADYDNGILQADDFIRQIFATLERKGYLADSIGAITADHGEGLGEHGKWGHTSRLYLADIGIPILFFDSEKAPVISAAVASQIDVAPTLLDQLGLPLPTIWEGYPLNRVPEQRDLFLTSRRPVGGRGVIRVEPAHAYRYLFFADAPGMYPESLVDILRDPLEQNELIGAASPGLLRQLRESAARHFRVAIPVH